MPAKRASSGTSGTAMSPFVNAILVAAAAGYGLWLLVAHRDVSWPPHELLANAYTVAGCLALVGPVVLLRRDEEIGLGELLWMTGGLLVWIFDIAGILRGEGRSLSFPTPLGATPMGLTILAVLLGGWKARGGGGSWSWTNVTGWVLGVFWVGMAVVSIVPGRTLGLAAR
jgi:hypothetical protein